MTTIRIYETTNDMEEDDHYKGLKAEGRKITIQPNTYHPRSEGDGKYGCSICQEYHKIANQRGYDLIVMSDPYSQKYGYSNEEHINGLLMKKPLRWW